jgi:uncharacterized protein (DUF58 family)
VTTTASHLDPETLAQLQGLELRARYIVDGYLSGKHRSAHRGHSVEFTEHREYAAGDDLRYVDWKVFGKTDKVYLKQFEAETNLYCHLLVDVSESMCYQSDSAPLSKLEYAQCLAAALGYIVLRQRDSVSLATFDDEVRQVVRESSNPAHLRQLTTVLDQADSSRKSQLGGVLHELSKRLIHRGVVVVVSDLLGDVDSLLSGLKHLRHERHELSVLQLLDPAEVDFPFQRTTLFEGLEAMPDVLAEPRGVRRAYLEALREFLDRIQTGCRALQVDYRLVQTNEPFDAILRHLLTSRSARRG